MSTKMLSEISGLSINEIEDIAHKVQENTRRLRGCSRHRFGAVKLVSSVSAAWPCLDCGGEMRISDIRLYAAGYVAGGGKESDIWTLAR